MKKVCLLGICLVFSFHSDLICSKSRKRPSSKKKIPLVLLERKVQSFSKSEAGVAMFRGFSGPQLKKLCFKKKEIEWAGKNLNDIKKSIEMSLDVWTTAKKFQEGMELLQWHYRRSGRSLLGD